VTGFYRDWQDVRDQCMSFPRCGLYVTDSRPDPMDPRVIVWRIGAKTTGFSVGLALHECARVYVFD